MMLCWRHETRQGSATWLLTLDLDFSLPGLPTKLLVVLFVVSIASWLQRKLKNAKAVLRVSEFPVRNRKKRDPATLVNNTGEFSVSAGSKGCSFGVVPPRCPWAVIAVQVASRGTDGGSCNFMPSTWNLWNVETDTSCGCWAINSTHIWSFLVTTRNSGYNTCIRIFMTWSLWHFW